MKTSVIKYGIAVLALSVLSTAANAAVSISAVGYGSASTLSDPTLVTNFDIGNSSANLGIASGYTFTWSDDNGHFPGSTTVDSNATGIYDNFSLISGIAARPPGSTGQYFAVVGPQGQAILTTPKPLESLSLLWGSVDNYNSIEFIGTHTYTLSGQDVLNQVVPSATADGTQSGDPTNREFLFTFAPGDNITEVVFSSTSNSFEFDNIAVAVPEPSVWLMMIAGFGLTGLMLRRRAGVAAVTV